MYFVSCREGLGLVDNVEVSMEGLMIMMIIIGQQGSLLFWVDLKFMFILDLVSLLLAHYRRAENQE